MADSAVSTLPDDTSAAGIARRRLRSVATHWSPPTLDLALLLTSELVTNAVRHGSGPVHLKIHDSTESVVIEVHDTSDARPTGPTGLPDGSAEGGRGIPLLVALAAAWGVDDLPGGIGKNIWFTLRHLQST